MDLLKECLTEDPLRTHRETTTKNIIINVTIPFIVIFSCKDLPFSWEDTNHRGLIKVDLSYKVRPDGLIVPDSICLCLSSTSKANRRSESGNGQVD